MKKKTVWIDMDDTICDFMTPWIKDVNVQINYLKQRKENAVQKLEKYKHLHTSKRYTRIVNIIDTLIPKLENFINLRQRFNLTEDEKKFFTYPQSRKNFLLNLEPIPGAKENIAKIHENFDVKILTKPSFMNPLCYTEKRLWIEEHYGLSMCEHLYFAPDKSYIIGDYLIDDNPWDFSGVQLHFGKDDLLTWDATYQRLCELEGI